jgi:hypothetical protein
MEIDTQTFIRNLDSKLKIFDKAGATALCQELIVFLFASSEVFPLNDARKILQLLRRKRMFALMSKVADACINTGRTSYAIRKLYSQSLIDTGHLVAAKAVLHELISDTEQVRLNDKDALVENIEAKGLLGRVYKQLYVTVGNSNNTHSIKSIKDAITCYLDVYTSDNTHLWHGINAVALINRAKIDGVDVSGYPDHHSLAEAILLVIEEKRLEQQAFYWDFATASEACIALNRPGDALEWLSGYARMPECDAFELGSTLRQFEEIWQLGMNKEIGNLLLPILRAELLQKEGGAVIIDGEALMQQKKNESSATEGYKKLIKDTSIPDENGKRLEKVFGDDSFKTYKWYMKGADRCAAVARIGIDSAKGFGTGFLMRGRGLCDALGEELILVTNAHVISGDPQEKAIHPNEALIIFEALDRDAEFRLSEIIWSSSSSDLDAAICRFSKEDQAKLEKLTEEKKVKLFPAFEHLPIVDEPPSQRIYLIGHPNGGTLQLSFQDNVLLDIEIPFIHYRTPTEGGSSGSPVFNQQWDLIGLHHAGDEKMPRLNGKQGLYEANEGIWIQSVRQKMCQQITI